MTNCTTAKCTSLFARYRVPTVYPFRIFAEVGRLVSYGTIYVCFSNRPVMGWTCQRSP